MAKTSLKAIISLNERLDEGQSLRGIESHDHVETSRNRCFHMTGCNPNPLTVFISHAKACRPTDSTSELIDWLLSIYLSIIAKLCQEVRD